MGDQPEKRHQKRRPRKPKGLWARFVAWLYRKPPKPKRVPKRVLDDISGNGPNRPNDLVEP